MKLRNISDEYTYLRSWSSIRIKISSFMRIICKQFVWWNQKLFESTWNSNTSTSLSVDLKRWYKIIIFTSNMYSQQRW
jgi:hypothetical protein